MTDSTLDVHALCSELANGLTLVTGNSRLARVMAIRYGQWHMEQGARQWPSPDILSWEAWLSRLWETASLESLPGTERAVPGKHQLLSLWERTLREDAHVRQLLRPESLAARLRDTRQICVHWQLDMRHSAWLGDENENHAAFHHWNESFEALCRQENWLPPEDRIAVLSRAIRDNILTPRDKFGLMGFDEFNPAQQALIDDLAASGVDIKSVQLTPARPGAALWKSRDNVDEAEQMARWVRHWSEAEPRASIAVVVPDLHTRRREVERHLAEILTPAQEEGGIQAKPWNISLGKPLIQLPMIESAFDLLRWLDKRIEIQDVGRVLRSPWFDGGITERNSRALLEKCLRENYPRQLKLREVRYRASELNKYDSDRNELPPDQQEPQPWNSPVMASIINRLDRFQRESGGSRKFSAWAEAIDGLLVSVGWPDAGGTGTNPETWQIIQAWQDALRGLASLDATGKPLGRKAAVAQLQQVCREQLFQARTPPANIQVLGLYEVSGLQFDHLWIMGLNNGNWPPAAQPNPFIPAVLQQKALLPQSSPQRELEVARTITQRLVQTAPDCIFSYPGQVEGEEVLASPLLSEGSCRCVDQVPGWPGERWQSSVHASGPPLSDTLLMPGPPAAGTARGGSSILKHQALCPFRAFAVNRLGAEGLETPVEGISPALHGSLIHRVLENFWRQTGSQANLLALGTDGLQERIRLHVEQVVNDERSLIDRPEFRDVENKRLQRLVAAHLEREKQRDPFEVVAFEREILQEIEGQQIRLIIDRIDRLPSGEEIIIDYKTGKVQPGKWFGDRPDDPQLPLYAISSTHLPAAVVFSVIRDDECVYKGVTAVKDIFPGLPPVNAKQLREAGENMAETIEQWRAVLHRLMADFLAGEARVDPKDGLKTCSNSYCDLHSLCRIHELEGLS